MRADAAVNSANTMAAWAELLPPAEAVGMLNNAQQAYQAALTQEEDAAVNPLAHSEYHHLQLFEQSISTISLA